MKLATSLILLLFISKVGGAQESEHPGLLQFNFGVLRTLHYQRPVQMKSCIEYCYAEEQRAGISKNFELGYYKIINQMNELKLGAGKSEYRFREKGLASPGDDSLLPYDVTIDNNFYSFSLGHKYIFNPDKKYRPFIENNVMLDLMRQNNYSSLKSKSLAIATRIGIHLKLSQWNNLVLNGFFKSAILNYNGGYGDKYLPFAYGIELGVTNAL